MKGIVLNILSSFLIVIGVIAVVSLFVLLNPFKESVEPLVVKRDIHVMGNALEYGGVVAETSLVWSFQQGCWDFLGSGAGAPGGMWYDLADQTPGKEEFLSGLGEAVAGRLNEYGGKWDYVRGFEVSVPKDYSVRVEELEDGARVKTASGSKISVGAEYPESQKSVSLWKDSGMERDFQTSCIRMFMAEQKRGKELGKGFERLAAEELNGWGKSGSVELEGRRTFGSARDMANFVLREMHGKGIGEVEEEIRASLLDGMEGLLPGEDRGFSLSVKVLGLDVEVIAGSCRASIIQKGEPVMEHTLVECPGLVYSVEYRGEVRAEAQEEVAVLDGEVGMRRLVMEFEVRAGLDADSHVELPSVDGEYRLVLEGEGLGNSEHPLGLLETGDGLKWSVGVLGGFVSGTGSVFLDEIIMEDVPLIARGEFGEPLALVADFEGLLLGDGSIEGTFEGTAEEAGEVSGTFTASPVQGG